MCSDIKTIQSISVHYFTTGDFAKSVAELLKNGHTPSDKFCFQSLLYYKHSEKRSERKEPSQNTYKAANLLLSISWIEAKQRGVNYEADQDSIYSP